MSEEKEQPALVEIRRSQLEPGKKGQHTNGPAPFWIRFGAGPWRRFGAYRAEAKLRRDLRDLLDVEVVEGEEVRRG